MVARSISAAKLGVDIGLRQSRDQPLAKQQEVHAETGVALKGVRVHPERINLFLGIQTVR